MDVSSAPQIVSTTLVGPGAWRTLRVALESVVGWVDRVIVIDTTSGAESAEIEEQARLAAGEKLEIVRWTWIGDFGAARNAALEFAAYSMRETGGGWCFWVDSDEWISLRGDLRREILETDAPSLYVAHESGSYSQPRAIRLPCSARWDGRVHEAIPLAGPLARSAVFAEWDRTPEEWRARAERDRAVLVEVTKERPNESRWWYYLGDALSILERWEETIDAWSLCVLATGWNEERAWACYRAADVLSSQLGRHREAVTYCARGLALHAGIAELAWMAGLASWRAGEHEQAIYWSRLALMHGVDGRAYGSPVALDRRRGFKVPKGYTWGPAEVLRAAYSALGDSDGAAEAEATIERLKALA
jgi:tetratricopeptide (TPR) repeat protein